MVIRLYRAAYHDSIIEPCCFAKRLSDARQYIGVESGYGGPNLYRTSVDIDEDKLLDIRGTNSQQEHMLDETFQYYSIERLVGFNMGAISSQGFIMQTRVVDALIKLGYEWVLMIDDFPKDCETYVWLNDSNSDNEPALETWNSLTKSWE